MKRKVIIFIVALALIFITIGVILVLKSDMTEWTKGIYFRNIYGYSAFLDEAPTLEVYYYNVKNDDSLKDKVAVLVADSGEQLTTTTIDTQQINKNKYFVENKIVFQIELINAVITIDRLRFYKGAEYLEYEIGNYTVQQIQRDYEMPRDLKLVYGNTIFANYQLEIENVSTKNINIEVVANNDVFEMNHDVFLLLQNEKKVTTIKMLAEYKFKEAIYVLKPLIIFKYDDAEDVFHNTVIVPAIENERLTISDVLAFINKKKGGSDD